jgi:hypothetical protein
MSDYLGDWDEMYRAVGEPEDIYDDSRGLLAPPPPSSKTAAAQCLRCLGYRRTKFFWLDEEFEILGFRVTAERWDDFKRSDRRFLSECSGCGRNTHWVSRGWRHEGDML